MGGSVGDLHGVWQGGLIGSTGYISKDDARSANETNTYEQVQYWYRYTGVCLDMLVFEPSAKWVIALANHVIVDLIMIQRRLFHLHSFILS